MDTGAAKNLAGSYTLNDYEIEYLLPYNEYSKTEPSTASFTGISGTSQRARVMTDSPVYPGGALGKMRYKSHALDESNLPMLLCCGSMRSSGFIINMNKDTVYLPMDAEAAKAGRKTQWLELPLHWTGVHYLIPIDKADAYNYNLVNLTFNTEEVVSDNTASTINVSYPFGRVNSSKDWKLLQELLSEAAGKPVVIANSTSGTTASLHGWDSKTARSRENLDNTLDSPTTKPKPRASKTKTPLASASL